MHCARFSKLLLIVSILTTAACGADRSASPPVDDLTSRVKALGFSVSGMQDYGSYIVVEGDIRLEKAILLQGLDGSAEGAPSPGIRPPQSAVYQYQTTTTVSQTYVKQITVDLTNINAISDWAPAVRTAIAAYNASGSVVYMSEASPGDITFSSVPSIGGGVYIAIASWPYQSSPSGKPGRSVTVAEDFNYLALNRKQLTMAHELGHTLGLRHDNSPNVDGDFSAGVYLVSGTPPQDASSIMKTPQGSNTWVGFSNYDLVALRALYPVPPPFSVSISGPQYVTRYQSAQYFAAANGTAPHTYEWRSRQCYDSQGFNCGAWQNWFSTGSQNYTYASINSCNLVRNELQVRVTDAVPYTITSSTYPIWITNPC